MTTSKLTPVRICIIGSSGSGKDTLADILSKKLPNVHVLHFADKLKLLCAKMLRYAIVEGNMPTDITEEDLLGSEGSRAILRTFWQWFGTEFVRNVVQKDYWIHEVEKSMRKLISVDPHVSIVIPDCRFENEHEWARKNNFVMVGVFGMWRQPSGLPGHSSELTTLDLEKDLMFTNTGTIQDMEIWVDTVLIPHCRKALS